LFYLLFIVYCNCLLFIIYSFAAFYFSFFILCFLLLVSMPKRRSSTRRQSGRGIGDWFRNLGSTISSGVKSLGNTDTYKQLARNAVDPYLKLKDAAIAAGKSLSDKDQWKTAILNPKDTWESQTKPWLKNNNVVSTLTGIATGGIPGMIANKAIKSTTGYGAYRRVRGGNQGTPGGGRGLGVPGKGRGMIRRKGLGMFTPGGGH
jgi:hypothetical protein